MEVKVKAVDLEKRIKELENENLLLQEKVLFLTRKLYGRTTEQTSSLGFEGQMSLFDEAEESADASAPEPDMKDVLSYRRKKRKDHKEELLKDVPHRITSYNVCYTKLLRTAIFRFWAASCFSSKI